MTTTNDLLDTTTETTINKNSTVLIPASEKVTTANKFITASDGIPREHYTDRSEVYKDHLYQQQSKHTYNRLPKNMKTISASISHCHHTGTKLAMGTSFNNCPELMAFVKSQHPIFEESLPLATTLRVYSKAATTTERYIAMTAILVKSGIINTVAYGLHLNTEQVNFLRPCFEVLVAVLNQAMNYPYKTGIDTLKLDSETCLDHKRLITHIKECTQVIDSATYAAGGTKLVHLDDRTTKQLKLDDELELERELSKVLSGYSTTSGNKYTSQLNKWTRRTLQRSEMTEEQVTMTMRILNTSPDQLRSGTIEAMIDTVTENLYYDDEISRRNSAIVIRHLRYKIELQQACLYKNGFIAEVVAEEVSSDKSLVNYVAKTKAREDIAVAAISKSNSPALERMRAMMLRGK